MFIHGYEYPKGIKEHQWKQNIDFESREVTDVKYGRMQKYIPSWLVCGSCGTCLASMLSEV